MRFFEIVSDWSSYCPSAITHFVRCRHANVGGRACDQARKGRRRLGSYTLAVVGPALGAKLEPIQSGAGLLGSWLAVSASRLDAAIECGLDGEVGPPASQAPLAYHARYIACYASNAAAAAAVAELLTVVLLSPGREWSLTELADRAGLPCPRPSARWPEPNKAGVVSSRALGSTPSHCGRLAAHWPTDRAAAPLVRATSSSRRRVRRGRRHLDGVRIRLMGGPVRRAGGTGAGRYLRAGHRRPGPRRARRRPVGEQLYFGEADPQQPRAEPLLPRSQHCRDYHSVLPPVRRAVPADQWQDIGCWTARCSDARSRGKTPLRAGPRFRPASTSGASTAAHWRNGT